MILFYSEYCQHCKVLLDTIKRHDKNNLIKLVSIDLLRSLKKPIDEKIHSVPALLIIKSKEYLFGKGVFDYLLLPNRGILFQTQITRDDKTIKDAKEVDINNLSDTKLNKDEPESFSLGSITSDTFSSLDENITNIVDKNYKWDMIDNNIELTNNNNIINDVTKPEFTTNNETKKLPTMEEIMKQRSEII